MYCPLPKDIRATRILIFRGRFNSLPYLRDDRNGNPVATFRVATDDGIVRCFCTGETAEAVARNARIGQLRLWTAGIYGSSSEPGHSYKILGWDRPPECATDARTAAARP